MKTIGNKDALKFVLDEINKDFEGLRPGEFIVETIINELKGEKKLSPRQVLDKLDAFVRSGKFIVRKVKIDGRIKNAYSYAPGQNH